MKNIILMLSMAALGAFGGKRPYEFEWANRTADDRPVLMPIVSSEGWRVEESNVKVSITTGTERVLFGDGVMRVKYRATGSKPSFKLCPIEPVEVPVGADTLSLWIYGNSIRDECPKIIYTANFVDAAGEKFSFVAYRMRHMGWFLMQVKCPKNLLAQLGGGAKFTGFTITGCTNNDNRQFEMTSLAIFKEELKPLSFKPQPKRPYRLFPDAPAGANTGEGVLPFPTRENTVIADEAVVGTVRADCDEDGTCRLSRYGADGRLEIRLPSKLGSWDDMAMRWNGMEWKNFAYGGGFKFASKELRSNGNPMPSVAPKAENVGQWRRDGNTFVREGMLTSVDGRTATVRIRARIIGKALSFEIVAKGGEIERIDFGACEGMPDAEQIALPYFPLCGMNRYRASVMSFDYGGTFFHLAFADWTQSNASEFSAGRGMDKIGNLMSNGYVVYGAKTDGTRNDCYERFVYAFSPVFEEVMPVIPNPPSPYRELTADYQWCHIYLGKNRDPQYPMWRNRHRRGLKKVMIHDWETCMRDEHESFTFRKTAAPGKGGDKGMYDFTRFLCDELGYLYGPYNNYTDFAPVNGYWNEGRAARYSDGNFIPAWYRCYSPRPVWCPEACDEIVSELQRKYRFNTGYCDVQTCIPPWSRTDYDARVAGAATFASTFYSYGLTLLKQRKNWTGPVYSEGGNHYFYCGLDDGNFAQDQSYGPATNPWLVDFDLRRLHPLANNFGMGYFQMFYGQKKVPKDRYAKLDRFLAATVAFGHIGYFCIGNAEEEDQGYFMVQAIAGKYARSDVEKIRYFDRVGRPLDTSTAVANGAFRRSQLTVRYKDGTTTIVNGSPIYHLAVPMCGKNLVLPANGWYALSGDRTVSVISASLGGNRCDLSVSPNYVYVNARGKLAKTAYGETDGALIRLIEDGGSEEVFIWRDKTGASLPYVAQSVVKVDEAGKENGAAEFKIVDGKTILARQDGAYSFRVRPVAGTKLATAVDAVRGFLVDEVPPQAEAPDEDKYIELPRSHIMVVSVRGGEEKHPTENDNATFAPMESLVSCGGVAKQAYVTHPPYDNGAWGYVASKWRVKLPEEYTVDFKAFVGMIDGHNIGDGVDFKVVVIDDEGNRKEVAMVHTAEQHWEPISADLSPWQGKIVKIVLISDCGAAHNTQSDWSAWGDLHLHRRD